MRRPHNYIDLDVDEILDAYFERGESLREIAGRLGISAHTVRDNIRRAGRECRTGRAAMVGRHMGDKNPNWNGGMYINKVTGYIWERRNGIRRAQHRWVAEDMLGRPLGDGECVHHKNGDRTDNRPENLEILDSHASHMRKHCDSETMRERGLKRLRIRWERHRAQTSAALVRALS